MPPPGCSAMRMATEALFARNAANLDEEFDAGALGSQDDAGSTDSGGEDEVEAGSGPCVQKNVRRSQRNTSRVVALNDELAAYDVGSLVEVQKSGKGSFWNAKVVQRRSGTDAAGKPVEEAQMKYVDEEGNYTRNRALWLTIGDLDKLRPPQPSKEEAAAAKDKRRQEKKEKREEKRIQKEIAKETAKLQKQGEKKEAKKRKRDAERARSEAETASRLAANELELSSAQTPQLKPPNRRGKADKSIPSEPVQAARNAEKLCSKVLHTLVDADARSNVTGRRKGEGKGVTYALVIFHEEDKENAGRVGRPGRPSKAPNNTNDQGSYRKAVMYLSDESNLTYEDVGNLWLEQGSGGCSSTGDNSGYCADPAVRAWRTLAGPPRHRLPAPEVCSPTSAPCHLSQQHTRR